MTTNLDAIYENGNFRLIGEMALPLAEGTQVRLTVESISKESKLNVLDLAAQVYSGLSESDIAEVEKIAAERSHFFAP